MLSTQSFHPVLAWEWTEICVKKEPKTSFPCGWATLGVDFIIETFLPYERNSSIGSWAGVFRKINFNISEVKRLGGLYFEFLNSSTVSKQSLIINGGCCLPKAKAEQHRGCCNSPAPLVRQQVQGSTANEESCSHWPRIFLMNKK